MALETLLYKYTTTAAMDRLASSIATNLMVDDLDASNVTEWDEESIEEATDIVNQYCSVIYTEESLSTSLWVERRTTWIACHIYFQRRGQMSPYEERYNEIIAELIDVRNQKTRIPRLPMDGSLRPRMSNIYVSDRHMIKKERVQEETSVGGPSDNQHTGWYTTEL